MINVAIVGVTSWGITLADLLVKNGLNVTICARNKEDVEDFTNKRLKIFSSNNLKKFQEINITTEYYENLKNADMVLISVPSKSFRNNIQNIKQYLSGSALLISATKGLEINTSMRMSQILYDELQSNQYRGISVLSGPNLAAEIIQEIPSSTVIASDNKRITLEVRKFFSSKFFHVYTSSDVIGVEFGGALKNIIAIGVGICYGLKYGNNTVATFITSGFNEMIKLGLACGALEKTFLGFSGLGDLITTCSSNLSRNRYVGEQLAIGKSIFDIKKSMSNVAEGVDTIFAAQNLSELHNLDLPIINGIYNIVFNDESPDYVIKNLTNSI